MNGFEIPCAQGRPRKCLLWLVLVAVACGKDPERLDFRDYLFHQQNHQTTGLVAVGNGLNSDRFGFGWRLDETEAQALLRHPIGEIHFFAAGGEIRELILRAAIDLREGRRKRRHPCPSGNFRLLINERPIGRLTFDTEWEERRKQLPPGIVRTGHNVLALRCLDVPINQRRRGRGSYLLLRQLRLLPAPARGEGIQLEARTTGGSGWRMDLPAYVDLVAELPPAARFQGVVTAQEAVDRGEIVVTLRVTAAAGETTVGEWTLRPGQRRELSANLSRWAGELVSLRLAAHGSARLEWRQAAVTGRGGPERGGRLPVAGMVAPPRSGRLERPDVVFILLDAARADAFAPFGGPYPTPALERLAADGTTFARAYSTAPWTRQSVASVLTGLFPDTVGAGAWGSELKLQSPTLAELLSAAGYRTNLWHEHPFYRKDVKLTRGFDDKQQQRVGLAGALPPVELLFDDERPTFTFVHIMPPHTPYEPPPPFRGAFTSWYEGDQDASADALNQLNRHDAPPVTADDVRYVKDRYLENAAYADSLVGRILERIDASGRWDDSLIVVLSDHGEAFREHGRFLHAQQLYDELLHVPLIVKWPAAASGHRAVVERRVSLVDLVPTLVDGLALSTDASFQGHSLLPYAFDGAPDERPIYAMTRGRSQVWRPPAPSQTLIFDGWKAIYEPLTERVELYDLASDPGEQHDLAGERPIEALLWRQALLEQAVLNTSLFGAGGPEEEVELDPELEAELRALGYLGAE